MRDSTVILVVGVSILVIIAFCSAFLPVGTNPTNISPQVIQDGTGMQDYKTIDYFNGIFLSSEPLEMNRTVRLTLEIKPDIDLQDTRIVFSLPWGIEHIDGEPEADLGSIQASDVRTVSIDVKMTDITDVRNIHVIVSANSSGHPLSKGY